MWIVDSNEIMYVESLIYESKVGTMDCNRLYKKAEMFSVGPWHPETMGLILWGFFNAIS